MSASRIFRSIDAREEEHWISVADLMAGLMVIFLFIAITYIRDIRNERDTMRQIAVTWQEDEEALYDALNQEFMDDLTRWDATLDREKLSIQFRKPGILFDRGLTTIKPQFKTILADFFPRYLNILSEFKEKIEEVRIEGHTSSTWRAEATLDQAYFGNMTLSQGRTRAVLEYSLTLPKSTPYKTWAKRYITANGLSSSQIILNESGIEDKDRSRRVEFRVVTRAKDQMVRILKESGVK